MNRRPSYFDDNYDELMEKRRMHSLKNILSYKIDIDIIDIINKARNTVEKTAQIEESDGDLPEISDLPEMPDLDKIIEEFDARESQPKHEPVFEEPEQDKPASKPKSERQLSAGKILLVIFLTLASIFKTIVKGIKTLVKKRPITNLLNSRKKWIVTLSLLLFTVIIFTGMVGVVIMSVNKENAKIQRFDKDAGIVCSDYIKKYGTCNYENLYQSYGIAGYRMTGLSYIRELDFDGDSTSELLLCYNDSGKYYVEVWGYVDNDFTKIYHGNATQINKKPSDCWVTLYYHNGKYLIGAHNKKDIEKVDLYEMKGNKFEKKSSCTYDKAMEAFLVKDEINYTDFERIRLAILREEKATVVQNQVVSVLDDFSKVSGEKIETEFKPSANSAYYEIVKDYQQKYGIASYKKNGLVGYADGLAGVKLINFDGKGKNELMLVYRKSIMTRSTDSAGNYVAMSEDKYFCDIYAYVAGKAKLVYQSEGLSKKQNNDVDVYALIQKDGKKSYLCSNTFSVSQYGQSVTGVSSILEFDGETFSSKQKARFETSYGYSRYYINDKSVYRTEFMQKGYTVPFFDGTDSFDANNFEVMYYQSSTKNATSIENQIDATNSTIAKLSKR